ncbi:hypothetical protein KC19_6G134100, partial [Ceratodon purpureus]
CAVTIVQFLLLYCRILGVYCRTEISLTTKAIPLTNLCWCTKTKWMVDKASGTVASFNRSFTLSYRTAKELSSSQCSDGLVFRIFSCREWVMSRRFLSSQFESNGLFTVEFDLYNNYPCFDTSDSHIGVDLNNTSLAFYNLCGGRQDQCPYFSGNKGGFTAWIDYYSAEETLEVRFIKGSSGVERPWNATFMVYKVRLDEFLDEYMHVGFTGSTGQASRSGPPRRWLSEVWDVGQM